MPEQRLQLFPGPPQLESAPQPEDAGLDRAAPAHRSMRDLRLDHRPGQAGESVAATPVPALNRPAQPDAALLKELLGGHARPIGPGERKVGHHPQVAHEELVTGSAPQLGDQLEICGSHVAAQRAIHQRTLSSHARLDRHGEPDLIGGRQERGINDVEEHASSMRRPPAANRVVHRPKTDNTECCENTAEPALICSGADLLRR
ncbi:hypothetical protein SDC9_161805 [bioreactor metagenome]|uniref:Uncharacterized protein n=1 Tax=bioreactor metagenome TaxID=1076179 RepID=A0A645FJ99_9ZZZZ